jgi:hypothetical protein
LSRPFDAARYEGLLEGLEIAELKLSEILTDNTVFRFDADYFGKLALAAIRRFHAIGAGHLDALATVTDGIHESLLKMVTYRLFALVIYRILTMMKNFCVLARINLFSGSSAAMF